MKTGSTNPSAPPYNCGIGNGCDVCDSRNRAVLLTAADGGQVYRDSAGVLHRQGVILADDDAAFLEPLIDCPPGRTAHLNEAGRTSAWRRPTGGAR